MMDQHVEQAVAVDVVKVGAVVVRHIGMARSEGQGFDDNILDCEVRFAVEDDGYDASAAKPDWVLLAARTHVDLHCHHLRRRSEAVPTQIIHAESMSDRAGAEPDDAVDHAGQ